MISHLLSPYCNSKHGECLSYIGREGSVILAWIEGLVEAGYLNECYLGMKEQKKRTVAKAITWQIIGFVAMMCIALLYTGTTQMSLSMTIITTLMGSVSYVVHERIWNRNN